MSAVSLCFLRLNTEEGRRAFAYNDATGRKVTCEPQGNLTIAVGVNLEEGLDDEEIDWLSQHRLTACFNRIYNRLPWFGTLDEARQSVLLDIGYNEGVGGLLNFPKMLAAVQRQDWKTAQAECQVEDPELQARYTALGEILFTGSAT
jgi:lysozyme